MIEERSIFLYVNNKSYFISNVDPRISLNSWLRDHAGLTGTKWMCNEGGCGACAVVLKDVMKKPKAVNSVSKLLSPIFCLLAEFQLRLFYKLKFSLKSSLQIRYWCIICV